jgi:hypothetical protein
MEPGGFGLIQGRAREQGYIDIFEDLTGRYAENAVGGFE